MIKSYTETEFNSAGGRWIEGIRKSLRRRVMKSFSWLEGAEGVVREKPRRMYSKVQVKNDENLK